MVGSLCEEIVPFGFVGVVVRIWHTTRVQVIEKEEPELRD